MPIHYDIKPKFYDLVFDEENEITEQEHKNSCDINLMMKALHHGMQVRGQEPASYGYDDLTLTGLDHRINKQKLEDELFKISKEHEFSEEEFEKIPTDVKKMFEFKVRKKQDHKNDPQNNVVTKQDQKIESTKNEPSNQQTPTSEKPNTK